MHRRDRGSASCAQGLGGCLGGLWYMGKAKCKADAYFGWCVVACCDRYQYSVLERHDCGLCGVLDEGAVLRWCCS